MALLFYFYLYGSAKKCDFICATDRFCNGKVREHLDRMTETGMFGKNAAETANLLLIDSIREYIEKGSTFLDSKSEDQKSPEIPK